MPKLYTKTGDNGLSSLFDGTRHSKKSLYFDVLGTIDELNSHMGLLCAMHLEKDEELPIILRKIQCKLINMGGIVAGSKDIINKDDVKDLELHIDRFETRNSKLTQFILPGYYTIDAQCHVCRSVCRRLERYLWKLCLEKDDLKPSKELFKWINRLSDLLFAYSRNLSQCQDYKVIDFD